MYHHALEKKISSFSSIATLSAPSLDDLECFSSSSIDSILGEAPKPTELLIVGFNLDSFLLKEHEQRSFWLKCFTNSINLNQKDPSVGIMFEAGQ